MEGSRKEPNFWNNSQQQKKGFSVNKKEQKQQILKKKKETVVALPFRDREPLSENFNSYDAICELQKYNLANHQEVITLSESSIQALKEVLKFYVSLLKKKVENLKNSGSLDWDKILYQDDECFLDYLFYPQTGDYLTSLIKKSFVSIEEKKLFKELFLIFQSSNYSATDLGRPFCAGESGVAGFVFHEKNLERLINLLIYLFQNKEITKNLNLKDFIKVIIAKTRETGNYRLINMLLEPIKLNKEGNFIEMHDNEGNNFSLK